MARFTINDESKATFVKKKDNAITGIVVSPAEAQIKIKETLGDGIAQKVQNAMQHKGR